MRRNPGLVIPLANRTLARGGTRCQCGAEKDRRATVCRKCVVPSLKGTKDFRYRALLNFYRYGLTYREIAVEIGVSIERVKQLVHLGLKLEDTNKRTQRGRKL